MIAALMVPVLAGAAPAASPHGDRVGAYDPATSFWSLDGGGVFLYGNPGDAPFMGDWDCDGKDTPGLHRPVDTEQGPAGKVYLRNSNSTGIADVEYFFGDPGDVAFAGDFNGDGCDSVGLFRPSTGQVFLTNLLGSANRGIGAAQVTYDFPAQGHDLSGARALAADFDGDGIDSVALHLPSSATVLGVKAAPMTFGNPGDQLVAGAFGGGVDSLGVYRADSFLLSDAPGDLTASAARSFSVGAGSVALSWSSSGTASPVPRSGHPCAAATIMGTDNADVINGTNGADVIDGMGGNDVIGGKDGDDTICGGDGDDILNGDKGADTIYGDAGVDNVNGNDGDDTLHGGPGADIITGDKDNDTLFGDGGADNMNGGSGNDFADGGDGDDLMSGATGDDVLLGRNGADVLNGGPGTDTCDLGADGASKSKCENNRPVANAVAVTTDEDNAVDGSFSATDAENDPLNFAIVAGSGPAEGSVVNNGNGMFTFDPGSDFQDLAVNESRTVTFKYTASDGASSSDPATVTVTVTGVNDPPTANDDTDTTDEETAKNVDVLGNDTDPDTNDVLSVSAVDTTGTTGSVTNNSSDVTYDPNGQFESLAQGASTTDSFGYTASDGNGGSDSATVTITVTGVNDAPVAQDVAAAATEDGGPVTESFDASDVDIGDTLTFTILTDPAEGSASNNNDGTFDFDPGTDFQDLSPGESRDVTFTYKATDNNGADSNTATVTVTVTGVVDPIVAVDDAYSTDADTELVVVAPGVLSNDTDPDGDAAVTPLNGGIGGINIAADGSLAYNPNGNYDFLGVGDSTAVSTDYTASNTAFQDTATVTITINGVNDAPTAINGAANGSGTFTITLEATDPDLSDNVEFTVTGVTLGSFANVVNFDGTNGPKNSATVDYTAPQGNPQDTLTFEVDDGNGGTDTGTITINQDPASEPPADPPGVSGIVADDASVESEVDKAVKIVLKANSDLAGDLTFSITSGPTQGTLSSVTDIDPDGAGPKPVRSAEVTYTPPAGTSGTFSFTFDACEVGNPTNCDGGTVTIRVDPPADVPDPTAPILRDVTKTLEVDETITFNLKDGVTRTGVEEVCNQPGAPCGRAAATTLFGSVTDPAGDATNSPSDDPANPDLILADVGVTAPNDIVAFEVRYVASGFDATSTRTGIVIDIDQNTNTGFPGVDAANNDSNLLGIEYLVNIGADLGANAEILQWVSGNTFTLVDTVPATILSDGHRVEFDLALLGDDDGFFNYKVTVQSQISPTPGFTGILDYMPDLGSAPGITNLVDGNGLVFTVLSLPAEGTLRDFENNAITTVPHRLTNPVVNYVAGSNTGSFSFSYRATNTAVLSTVADLVLNIVAAGTCEDDEAFCDNGRS